MNTHNATHFIEQYNPIATEETTGFFTPVLEISDLERSLKFTKENASSLKTVAIFIITPKNKQLNG